MVEVVRRFGTWKLALCPGCGERRMMPWKNASCLFCVEGTKRTRRSSGAANPGGRKPSVPVPALRMLREVKGFTISELARFSGVDYTTVMRLEERGETAVPQRAQSATAERLAGALGVEVGELTRRLRKGAA